MRISTALLFVGLACGACGGAQSPPPPESPMSAAEHLAAAERRDRDADAIETRIAEGRYAQPSSDVDAVSSVADSADGFPARPRWTTSLQPSAQYWTTVMNLRQQAAFHRRVAKRLTEVERDACRGLHPEDIDQGPFFQRRDVARVEPYATDGALLGARVVFKDVPGLTVQWMTRAVECSQARAAVLGYPPEFMRHSPLTLPGTSATVVQRNGAIHVLITARDEATATAVLGRAEALLYRPADESPTARLRQ